MLDPVAANYQIAQNMNIINAIKNLRRKKSQFGALKLDIFLMKLLIVKLEEIKKYLH